MGAVHRVVIHAQKTRVNEVVGGKLVDMLPLEEIRFERIMGEIPARFGSPPTETEIQILRESVSPHLSPRQFVEGSRPSVRAEFIRWIATDPEIAGSLDQIGVRVTSVSISGVLDFSGSRVALPLHFLFCLFEEELILRCAEVKSLTVADCAISKGIRGDDLVASGSVSLQGLGPCSSIDLSRAHIAGTFTCLGTILNSHIKVERFAPLNSNGIPARASMSLDDSRIDGSVFLGDGFQSAFEVRFFGAEVGGSFVCNGARLMASDVALNLDGARVGGWVLLTKGNQSAGHIRMHGISVRQGIELLDLRFTSLPEKEVLWLINADVGGDLIIGKGFECEGPLSIVGSRVGGDLRFFGPRVGYAICVKLRVEGDFAWLGIRKTDLTRLNLMGSSVASFRDDRSSWPRRGMLNLDGFIYEDLTLQESPNPYELAKMYYGNELDLNADLRVSWLLRQEEGTLAEPQPWLQLARLLESKGDHRGAKHVIYRHRLVRAAAVEFHPVSWLRRRASGAWKAMRSRSAAVKAVRFIRHPNRLVSVSFAFLEESPMRILYPILLSLLIGWLVFAHAASQRAMAPTEPASYEAFVSGKPLPSSFPVFSPSIYTLENVVPLVRLGQDSKWAPDQNHTSADFLSRYWVLMWVRWVLIISGWFYASILAAALVNRFKP